MGQAGVGWVQIVVAKRARTTERRRHRIADPPALEHDDPPDPLRRVIRREQPHDAASDHEEVAVTVEALAAPDAHALLARLRERAPLSWVPALDGWLVVRRDLALQVMGDAETFTVDDPRFSTGRVVGPSMLTLDGDEHQRHRAPFARPFRLQPVRERFTDVVADEVERLSTPSSPQGAAELRRAFAGPLAAAIVTHSLGLPEADTGAVLRWYDAIVAAVTEVTAGGRGARRRPRGVRGAAGRHRSGARSRARLVAAGRRRRRPRALGGHLQRRGHALRRHRDDRGHDRQRDRAPARRSRRSSRS